MICPDCRQQLIVRKEIYHVHGADWFVLYEYDPFLERLLFQWKEQGDVALAPLFLDRRVFRKWSRDRILLGPPSSAEKRMARGFETISAIYEPFEIYFPFYKTSAVKQSKQSAAARRQIDQIIQKKTLYPLPKGPYLLVDDVCTTGSTLTACLDLIPADRVFVLAGHPLWLETHSQNLVVKRQ